MKNIKKRVGNRLAYILVVAFCILNLGIIYKYTTNIDRIVALTTSVDIAKEYMNPRYDRYWLSIDEIDYAGQDYGIANSFVYEIGIREENYNIYYEITENYSDSEQNVDAIGCIRIIGEPQIRISSNFFEDRKSIKTIFGGVDVWDNEKECWKEEGFILEEQEGEYIVRMYWDEAIGSIEEIEEKTGMKVEEIVEIAKQDQDRLERIMHNIKDVAIKIEKQKFTKKIIYTNGILLMIVIVFLKSSNKKEMSYGNRNKSTIKE